MFRLSGKTEKGVAKLVYALELETKYSKDYLERIKQEYSNSKIMSEALDNVRRYIPSVKGKIDELVINEQT